MIASINENFTDDMRVSVHGGDGGGSNSPSRRYPERDVLQAYPTFIFVKLSVDRLTAESD